MLDTNVFISAFVFSGFCRRVVDRCVRNHRIVLSNVILDEFSSTLIGKFDYDHEEVRTAIDSVIPSSEIVEPATFETQICRDPDDDAILGTAVAGNADCIVTGDSDLLVLGRFQGVEIVSPSEFARYEVESQS